MKTTRSHASIIAVLFCALLLGPAAASERRTRATNEETRIKYRTVEIDGVSIFYREAGSSSNPTLLLLHGFPTSSHMFRNLIPALADKYHLVAPDFPGFGNSAMPPLESFEYSFDHMASIVEDLTLALGLEHYSMYLMDYGAPVGFRLAAKHPERVETLIIQNGNAYDEGLDNDFWQPFKAYWLDRGAVNQGLDNPFWQGVKDAYEQPEMANEDALRFLVTLGATQFQYLFGARDQENISPDNWHVTQRLLDRPGNAEIQLQLFFDYGSNVPLYPVWQAYLREHQPPTLIVWGDKDIIFPSAGAYPYARDLDDVSLHFFDTGHFALEEDGAEIAPLIRNFLRTRLPRCRSNRH